MFEFRTFTFVAGTVAKAVSEGNGDAVRGADEVAAVFIYVRLVPEEFGQWIRGVGRVTFLADAAAVAVGVVDHAENCFARFVGLLWAIFGVATNTGAIAFPNIQSEYLAILALDEFGTERLVG